MGVVRLLLCAALLTLGARAQDERSVASPDGQLEVRLFVAQPDGELPHLAYEVRYHGRTIIEPSLLALHIHNQEPMLGENDGLIASAAWPGERTVPLADGGLHAERIDRTADQCRGAGVE